MFHLSRSHRALAVFPLDLPILIGLLVALIFAGRKSGTTDPERRPLPDSARERTSIDHARNAVIG